MKIILNLNIVANEKLEMANILEMANCGESE